MTAILPTYTLNIQKMDPDSAFEKYSAFKVQDLKVKDNALRVLIKYASHDAGDPEVEAVWDGKKNWLYLVGGKEESAKVNKREDGTCIINFAKTHEAWVEIKLDPAIFDPLKTISVYGRKPFETVVDSRIEGGFGVFAKKEEHDIHLMDIPPRSFYT